VRRLDDPEAVREQYARDDNLRARQALYQEMAGPDPRVVLWRTLARLRPRDVLEVGGGPGELAERMQSELGARVRFVDISPGMVELARARGVDAQVGDVQELAFGDGSFDLIVSAGVLDSVNDLPGALTLARRMLRPDGLFVAAFVGGESLATLRSLLLTAEAERPAARAHPRIDVRSAGDLLVRAGFALPVADLETLEVRYRDLGRLFADLRGMGATSYLAERPPLARAALARAVAAVGGRADSDGRFAERFDLIFLTGWSPAPSQPQPARRGSGTASLADALRRGRAP